MVYSVTVTGLRSFQSKGNDELAVAAAIIIVGISVK